MHHRLESCVVALVITIVIVGCTKQLQNANIMFCFMVNSVSHECLFWIGRIKRLSRMTVWSKLGSWLVERVPMNWYFKDVKLRVVRTWFTVCWVWWQWLIGSSDRMKWWRLSQSCPGTSQNLSQNKPVKRNVREECIEKKGMYLYPFIARNSAIVTFAFRNSQAQCTLSGVSF